MTNIQVEKSAIILAGGNSKRFGQDKGLTDLAGKKLILHVFQRVQKIVDEVIIVVHSELQKDKYSKVIPKRALIVTDLHSSTAPLIGTLTGFKYSNGQYSVLLSCDTPFISCKVIKLLFDSSYGYDAVIPRWSNGYVEPLQAVYKTASSLRAAEASLKIGEMSMRSMIHRLERVRYIPTSVIKDVDPNLTTFFNINSVEDLKRAIKFFQ